MYNYETRNRDNFYILSTKKKGYVYYSVFIGNFIRFNELERDFKNIVTISLFKKKLTLMYLKEKFFYEELIIIIVIFLLFCLSMFIYDF